MKSITEKQKNQQNQKVYSLKKKWNWHLDRLTKQKRGKLKLLKWNLSNYYQFYRSKKNHKNVLWTIV